MKVDAVVEQHRQLDPVFLFTADLAKPVVHREDRRDDGDFIVLGGVRFRIAASGQDKNAHRQQHEA